MPLEDDVEVGVLRDRGSMFESLRSDYGGSCNAKPIRKIPKFRLPLQQLHELYKTWVGAEIA